MISIFRSTAPIILIIDVLKIYGTEPGESGVFAGYCGSAIFAPLCAIFNDDYYSALIRIAVWAEMQLMKCDAEHLWRIVKRGLRTLKPEIGYWRTVC